MKETKTLNLLIKDRFARSYTLVPEDIGEDACVSKNGTTLYTECYNAGTTGHLCLLTMSAMFGLMKMETAVFSPKDRDIPLINLDRVRFMKKETLISELYDIQTEPYPEACLEEFNRIKQADSDLADYVSGKDHWYDDILYPCSYH